jgi:hypothetical protein
MSPKKLDLSSVDSVIIRKEKRTDCCIPNAILIRNHLRLLLQKNLEVKKSFNFKKTKENKCYLVAVPLTNGKIAPIIETITPKLAKLHNLNYHIILERKEGPLSWMNTLPILEEENKKINFIGDLYIGFSRKKRKKKKK